MGCGLHSLTMRFCSRYLWWWAGRRSPPERGPPCGHTRTGSGPTRRTPKRIARIYTSYRYGMFCFLVPYMEPFMYYYSLTHSIIISSILVNKPFGIQEQIWRDIVNKDFIWRLYPLGKRPTETIHISTRLQTNWEAVCMCALYHNKLCWDHDMISIQSNWDYLQMHRVWISLPETKQLIKYCYHDIIYDIVYICKFRCCSYHHFYICKKLSEVQNDRIKGLFTDQN